MPDSLIELANFHTNSIIKVIGVGGGGGNAVGQMYRDNIPEVRYLVANTDKKALATSPVPDQLQLGPGLGAGGDPKKGHQLAEESLEKIKGAFDKDTHMVFITAGMGGGTGTGASPVIAHEAKAMGILTVGIVTIPFLFERERQIDKALDGLEILSKEVDALLVINNERLCEIYPDLSVIDAFHRADQTLSTAVSSITEIISMHGRINLDFEDVRTVLTDGGVAIMSTGYGEGDGRVTKAIQDALNSPLLNNNDVYRATRILLAITTSDEEGKALLTREITEVNEFMAKFDSNLQTKWGLAVDRRLGNKIKVTILASGYNLYDRKKKVAKSQISDEEIAEASRHYDRREEFYETDLRSPLKSRRKALTYILTDADLENSELLEELTSVPTFRRSTEMLHHIKTLSNSQHHE